MIMALWCRARLDRELSNRKRENKQFSKKEVSEGVLSIALSHTRLCCVFTSYSKTSHLFSLLSNLCFISWQAAWLSWILICCWQYVDELRANAMWDHYEVVNKSHVDISNVGEYFMTAIETLLVSQRRMHVKVSSGHPLFEPCDCLW